MRIVEETLIILNLGDRRMMHPPSSVIDIARDFRYALAAVTPPPVPFDVLSSIRKIAIDFLGPLSFAFYTFCLQIMDFVLGQSQ